jgi:cytochrome bd ubiquinol oxidase subunit I
LLMKRVEKMKLMKWLPLTVILPYLANTGGWVTTEVGRQPWIVQGLLKTENAMSPNLTQGMIWITLIGFVLLYAALMAADAFLLFRFAKAGPDATDKGVIGEPAPVEEK